MGINAILEHLQAANDAHHRVVANAKGLRIRTQDPRMLRQLNQLLRDHQQAHGAFLSVVEALNSAKQ